MRLIQTFPAIAPCGQVFTQARVFASSIPFTAPFMVEVRKPVNHVDGPYATTMVPCTLLAYALSYANEVTQW